MAKKLMDSLYSEEEILKMFGIRWHDGLRRLFENENIRFVQVMSGKRAYYVEDVDAFLSRNTLCKHKNFVHEKKNN